MNEKPNYKEAFDELQVIVSEIEGGSISVDELSKKVKRAIHSRWGLIVCVFLHL